MGIGKLAGDQRIVGTRRNADHPLARGLHVNLHLTGLKFCRHGPRDREMKIPITKSLMALLMEEIRHRLISFGGTKRDDQSHAVSSRGLLTKPGQKMVLHSLAQRPA